MATWHKTDFKGVRYRTHPDRKYGAQQDRYYVLTYKLNGKTKSEAVGWASEGVKPTTCFDLLRELKGNRKRGDGPRTLEERRKLGDMKREATAQKAAAEERKRITFRDYWNTRYLPAAKTKKKTTSWGKEQSHFTHWLEPCLGDIPMPEISLTDMDKVKVNLNEAKRSPRTIQYVFGTFGRCWKHAASREVVSGRMPTADLDLEPVHNSRERVLTPEEVQNILDALKEQDVHAWRFTLFAAHTGCRASEVFRLAWRNLDLNTGTAFFPETKNYVARTLPLPQVVVETLKELTPGEPGDVVFKSSLGKAYTEAPKAFREIVEKLGLNDSRPDRERAVFHTLRHTAATIVARGNLNVKDMQELFGWKSVQMVLRYLKGDDGLKRNAVNALSRQLERKMGKVIPLRQAKND